MRKCEIKIIDGDKKFITQAYLKNNFANIVSCCEERYSFRLCFVNMEVKGSWGKETDNWKEIAIKLNIKNIKSQLDEIFSNSAKKEKNLQLDLF